MAIPKDAKPVKVVAQRKGGGNESVVLGDAERKWLDTQFATVGEYMLLSAEDVRQLLNLSEMPTDAEKAEKFVKNINNHSYNKGWNFRLSLYQNGNGVDISHFVVRKFVKKPKTTVTVSTATPIEPTKPTEPTIPKKK